MKQGTKDLLRTCGIAFVLMLALPAVFRLWMASHPQPPRDPLSVPAAFDTASIRMTRLKQLLRRPLAKWSEEDRKAEPAVAAWLDAHAKVILPWEWSDVAREKDVSGYRNAWRDLLGDECKHADGIRDDIQDHKKACLGNMDRARVRHSHATNELARLTAICATNAYPASVEKTVLSKGLLWGWNRKQESVQLPDAQSAAALLDSLRLEAAEFQKEIGGNELTLKVLAEHEERFSHVLADLETIRAAWQKKDRPQNVELQEKALEAIVSNIHASEMWGRECRSRRGL